MGSKCLKRQMKNKIKDSMNIKMKMKEKLMNEYLRFLDHLKIMYYSTLNKIKIFPLIFKLKTKNVLRKVKEILF